MRDKSLELKLKGNENSCSQIHASLSDDAKYIICGSEDRKVYIWSTGPSEGEKDKRPVEMFEAHSAIVTTAIMAPTRTRQLLSASRDPLFDLCNPPPVTLVSRAQSQISSVLPAEDGSPPPSSLPPTPATSDFNKATKPEESPAYLVRCTHPDGNIIVTADFNGQIKVFRQDCAYQNRLRNNDSALSKKMLGRTNSVATKHSKNSRRESIQINHSSDRILSWRQSINSTNGSLDSFRNTNNGHQRSISPRKSLGQASLQSTNPHPSHSTAITTPSLAPSASPHPSPPHRHSPESKLQPRDPSGQSCPPISPNEKDGTPLMLHGDQSYMFWNSHVYQAQAQAAASAHLDPNSATPTSYMNAHSGGTSTAGSSNGSANGQPETAHLGAPAGRQITNVSRLSSEDDSGAESSPEGESGGEVVCRRCKGRSFRVRNRGEGGEGPGAGVRELRGGGLGVVWAFAPGGGGGVTVQYQCVNARPGGPAFGVFYVVVRRSGLGLHETWDGRGILNMRTRSRVCIYNSERGVRANTFTCLIHPCIYVLYGGEGETERAGLCFGNEFSFLSRVKKRRRRVGREDDILSLWALAWETWGREIDWQG